MWTSLILLTLGTILFVLPHHRAKEFAIFRSRSFLGHFRSLIREEFPTKPRAVAAIFFMIVSLTCLFWPALIYALARLSSDARPPILAFGALLCLLAAPFSILVMLFSQISFGFGASNRDLPPRTPIFYAIPAFLALAAVWFALIAFAPAWRSILFN